MIRSNEKIIADELTFLHESGNDGEAVLNDLRKDERIRAIEYKILISTLGKTKALIATNRSNEAGTNVHLTLNNGNSITSTNDERSGSNKVLQESIRSNESNGTDERIEKIDLTQSDDEEEDLNQTRNTNSFHTSGNSQNRPHRPGNSQNRFGTHKKKRT